MFLGPLSKSDKAIGVVISPLSGLIDQQVRNNIILPFVR